MNARQAAERIGVSERTVRRWIALGELSAVRRGREFVIDDALVEQLAAGQARPAADPELAAIARVRAALTPLDQPARDRVIRWAVDRFDIATA